MAKTMPYHDQPNGPPTGQMVQCPACGNGHLFNLVPGPNGVGGQKPVWTWNGDRDRPTFQASMLVRQPGANAVRDWMPIQDPPYRRSPIRVPFGMLDPKRCERNHDQTRERLRQRGGLGPIEALWIIDDVRFGSKEYEGSPAKLLADRVDAWLAALPEQVCHSFVRDGLIEFLGDCTHAMANQTVELPDW